MDTVVRHTHSRFSKLDSVERSYSDGHTDLLDALSRFCSCFEFAQIVPKLKSMLEQVPRLNVAYLLLCPDISKRFSMGAFANSSLSLLGVDAGKFGIVYRPGGVEITAEVSDQSGKTGVLSLGLVCVEANSELLKVELVRLANLLETALDNFGEADLLRNQALFSGLVHQIRNPLATIITAASQLSIETENGFDDDERMLIGFINTEADRIEKLLASFSAYARAHRLKLKEIDLGEFLESLAACLIQNVPGNILLKLDDCQKYYRVKLTADSEKLRQVIQLLMDNSMEALSGRQGTISIKIQPIDDHIIQIIVRDDGSGIRPELLRRVKEPFYSTKDGGSGLGLAIASRVVSAHGGQLKIYSDSGVFTEVCLELPRKIDHSIEGDELASYGQDSNRG